MKNLKNKVIYCLENYPQTRNCDISLTLIIWWKFHNSSLEFFNDDYYVRCKDLRWLPREDNVKRIRAKLQNDENKYLPTDEEVRKQRGIQEEQWRKYLGYNPELREVQVVENCVIFLWMIGKKQNIFFLFLAWVC